MPAESSSRPGRETNQETAAAQMAHAGCVTCFARPVSPNDEHMIFTCEHAGIGVGHLSLSGEWLRFNQMLCNIIGYSREQLLGKSIREITFHEDSETDRENLGNLLAANISSYMAEKRWIHVNGSKVWVHLTISLARRPDGAPDYFIVVAEDVSARKEAEAVRATLAAIVRNSADAIISESLDGVITSWNDGAQRIFGYAADEVLGRTVLMLAPPEKTNEVRQIMEGALAGESVTRMEAIRVRKDGQSICVALSAAPIRDLAGKTIGIAKIARDITDLKKADEQLREARQQLAEANARLEQQVQQRTAELRESVAEMEHMSYSIMHDMRAPLRAITAYSELIEADAATQLSGESREFLARTKTASHRLDDLICDVLNYSRIVRQGLDLHPVALVPLLRGIIKTYPAFQPSKATIDIAEDLPMVQGNEAALTQCFSNLLENAVKFVWPGHRPQIQIKARINDRKARIIVEDNGIGIEPQLHERIFGIFQRASNDHEGTGIGLAIVRKAAERMGGKAGVESELGKGSRFWIELPVAARSMDNLLKPYETRSSIPPQI